MTKSPPPVPEIRDAWGRVYVPRQPTPQWRNVPLGTGEILMLRAAIAEVALDRMRKGEHAAAQEFMLRNQELGLIALAMDPWLAEFINEDGSGKVIAGVG